MKKLLLLLLALLLALPATAQTKLSIFDRVGALGVGRTPAKGQLFYTSDAFGTISPLAIGSTNDCLLVSGAGVPIWTNACVGYVTSVGISAPAQFIVGGSPVTTSGTLALSWQTVSQNYSLMGPTSGSGVPTFRSITGGDLTMTTKGDIVAFSTVIGRLGVGTDGTVLMADSTQAFGLKWAAAAGTVTSVGLALPSSELTVSGSPVIGSGTLTAAWAVQNKNKFFVGPPNGFDAAPSFRILYVEDLGMTTKGDIIARGGSSGTPVVLAVGTNGQALLADSTTATGLKWSTLTGTGTVMSVGASVPVGFSVSGIPVIAAGTIAITLDSQAASKFLVSDPTGSASTPSFRALHPFDLFTNAAAKGDLLTLSAFNVFAPLHIGTDGFALIADSASTGGMKWSSVGAGTVVSVGLSMPSWYSVASSPVTGSGTLGVTAASGQLQHGFLAAPSGGTGALSVRVIDGTDLPACANTTRGGLTAPNDVTKFLRGDNCTWAVPAFVTSVAATVPGEMTLSGSPVTSTGTFGFGWAAQAAHKVFAGPTTGAPDVPAFRVLVGDDVPLATTSLRGAAPVLPNDAAKYLNGVGAYAVPTFSSSIEVKEVDGSPDVTGVSVLRFDQSTGLTVTDNTGGVVTIASTGGGGGSATSAKQDSFDGDGATTVFTLTSAPSADGVIYVALNGLPQITTSWSLSGSNVTMVAAPISGANLTIGYFTSLPGTVTHAQDDFAGAGATDFTLAHAPATNGVLVVALRGLIQPQTSWSIVSSTTLRFSSVVPTGDAVSCSYNY